MNILGWAKGALQTGRHAVVQNAPVILTGMGTIGVGTGLYFAIQAGAKAVYLTERAEREKAKAMRETMERQNPGKDIKLPLMEPLSFGEKVTTLAPLYLPPIGLTVFGLLCFWGAQGINAKRQAILMGLYSTAQGTIEEYQRKVVELIGKEKSDDIREAISEDKTKQLALPQESPAGMPGAGMTDIWFLIDGKTFPCTYAKVKEAQNEFNHEMLTGEMYKSRAELYWKLDPTNQWLRPTAMDYDVGWSIDKLLVLHVAQPFGPIATITYEDKDGNEYFPVPGFAIGR